MGRAQNEGQQWRQVNSAPEEQEVNEQLGGSWGEQEGVGRAKRSQGRRTEAWDALEQEQCGGSCGLEAVEERQCKAGSEL